jgi:protease-4
MKVRYPFLYLVLASALLAALLLVFSSSRKNSVLPGRVLARSKVALIDISGVITSSEGVSRGITSSRSVVLQLENYADDSSVKAVVLRINSPGGTVVAAQEVYSAIKRIQEESGMVVVASMADIAASGGYYIACAADHVIASPGTLTGSIGVIMEFPNLEGLFGKIGVTTTTIKSGKFKDTGSAYRQMTGEERALLQELLDDVHEQFIDSVRAGRDLPIEEVIALADGRIFTGKQALSLGLVDETGDLRKAILKAAELAGIDGEPTVLREKKKTRLWDLLESRVLGALPILHGGVVPGTGQLLYLWK